MPRRAKPAAVREMPRPDRGRFVEIKSMEGSPVYVRADQVARVEGRTPPRIYLIGDSVGFQAHGSVTADDVLALIHQKE